MVLATSWRSDEVEGWVLLFETWVWLWWGMSTTASLTDKSCQPVSVPDHGGLLDGTTHVVVGVAELVGQVLDLVRGAADGVVDDRVSCWSRHALTSCHRAEVELVDVLVCDSRVDDSTWERVLVAPWLPTEQPGVDSLAGVDVHELGGVTEPKTSECLLDLGDLRTADTLDLTFTNTVSVEDEAGWECAVGSFEGLAG